MRLSMKKNKKIALFGNSNNNFFSLARYLRDRGYNVDLFLCNNELPHFHPSCDSYSLDFIHYTFLLPFGNLYWFLEEIEGIKKNEEILKRIRKYDVIFANGPSVAYLSYFDIPIDFFVPYGMDLVSYPFYVQSANPNHRKHLDTFSFHQNKGIKESKKLLSTEDVLNVAAYEQSIMELGLTSKVIAFKTFPYIYMDIYQRAVIPKFFNSSYWAEDFYSLTKDTQFVVFHHARHSWKSVREEGRLVADKCNDRVLQAFAAFVKDNKKYKPKLLTFEYGSDINASKQMVEELGIQNYVQWLPIMNRKDIMVGLYYASCATGQFHIGCIGGGVQSEALVASVPLIHYVNPLKYNLKEIYPFVQAKEIGEIQRGFESCFKNPKKNQDKANEALKWMQKEMSFAVNTICELIEDSS